MNTDQTYTLTSELHEDWAMLQPMLWVMLYVFAAIGVLVVIRNIIRMYKENKK